MNTAYRRITIFWFAMSLCLSSLLVPSATVAVGGAAGFMDVAAPEEATAPASAAKSDPDASIVVAEPAVPQLGEPGLLERLDSARREGDEPTAALLQSQLDALYGVETERAVTEDGSQNAIRLSAPELGAGINWIDGDIRISSAAYTAAKPSIASAPNGDLYVAVENLGDAFVYLYKSTNNGKTWTLFLGISAGTESRNPSITYAENAAGKWVYVAFEAVASDGTRMIYVYRRAADNSSGSFVTVQSGITMASAADQIYPRITSDNVEYPTNPYLYLTYALYGVDYYPVYFRRSLDMGLTWTAAVNVTGGAENSSWSTRPDIAYGQSGLFISFEKLGWDGVTWNNDIFVRKSSDYGVSWDTPTRLTTGGDAQYHPRVSAAHGDDVVLVAFTDDYSNTGDLDIRYRVSSDGGATWVGTYYLASSGEVEQSVALAVSHQHGNFHAAWWRGNNIWYRQAPVATPTVWSSARTVIQSSTASSVYSRPSIAANPKVLLPAEAASAWTDSRDAAYHVYFDSAVLGAGKVGIWRPGTGFFYLDANDSGTWDPGIDVITVAFGVSSDIPVTGDWNGDGQTDVGVWRPSTGRFYLDVNGNRTWDPGIDVITVAFGVPTDIPVTGDWDGDGDTDVGVWRPSTGRFYLDANGSYTWEPGVDVVTVAFGVATDKPVTGDWNGDGQTDVGVWRPSTGSFYLDANGNDTWDPGVDVVTVAFGVPTDKPVTGDWNGDGRTEVGIWRPSTGSFYLDGNGNYAWDAGVDVITVSFGVSSDVPVTGAW